MKSTCKAFAVFDCFKRPVNLYSQNTQLHSTVLGTLLSLIIYTFIIFYFVTSDFLTKKNPKIAEYTYESRLRPLIDLKKVVVEIRGAGAQSFIDYTIFTVKLQKFSRTWRGDQEALNRNTSSLEMAESAVFMRRCRAEDFAPGTPPLSNYQNMLCTNQSNLSISGFWDEERFSYLRITLARCLNNTDPTPNAIQEGGPGSCKSSEEIESFFKNKEFFIHVLTPQFNMNKIKDLISYNWRTESQSVDTQFYKKARHFLKKVELVDEYHGSSESSSFALDKPEIDVSLKPGSPLILQADFCSSATQIRKIRNYQSFDEVMASIGGLASLLFVLGSLLTYPEYRLKVMLDLMSDVFSFSPPRIRIHLASIKKDPSSFKTPYEMMLMKKLTNESTQQNRKPEISNSEIEIMLKKKCSSEYIPPKELDTEEVNAGSKSSELVLEKGKKNEKSRDSNNRFSIDKIGEAFDAVNLSQTNLGHGRQFRFSLFDYCYYVLPDKCKKRQRKKDVMFSKLEEKYVEELSLSNVLRRIQDLETRVRLLFTREQRELLNLMPKMSIHSSHLNKIRRVDTAKEFLEEGVLIYEKLRNSKDITELDQRILNLIGNL